MPLERPHGSPCVCQVCVNLLTVPIWQLKHFYTVLCLTHTAVLRLKQRYHEHLAPYIPHVVLVQQLCRAHISQVSVQAVVVVSSGDFRYPELHYANILILTFCSIPFVTQSAAAKRQTDQALYVAVPALLVQVIWAFC